MFQTARMNTPESRSDAEDSLLSPAAQGVPVFLVQDTDAFIAEDILGSLKATGPCRVIDVRHPQDIATALAREPRLTAAFLEMDFGNVMLLDGAQTLLKHGAHIVLTKDQQDDDPVHSAGWSLLKRPFTEQMIHRILVNNGLFSG